MIAPFDLVDFFAGRDVDMRGLEVRSGSKTFRWQGSYIGAMNQATTDGRGVECTGGRAGEAAGKLSGGTVCFSG